MGLSFSARRDGVKVFSDEERRENSLGMSWATFSRIESHLGLTHTSDDESDIIGDVILDIREVKDACAAYLDTTQSKPGENDYSFISVLHQMACNGIERGANAIYGL
jgi:hypothetical protein